MTHMRRKSLILIAVLAVLAIGLWMAWQSWQGPIVPSYPVRSAPIEQWVVASGRVAAPSRVRIGTELTGVVAERQVRDGDMVQAGQVLARLVDDEWQARLNEATAALAQLDKSELPLAEAAVREAESRLNQARRELERRRGLLAAKAVSREDVEQAALAEVAAGTTAAQARLRLQALQAGGPDQALLVARQEVAQAALERTRIRSTVSGTVVHHDVEPGDLVQAGQVLFEVAAEGQTEVRVRVDERYLGVLALDQEATVVADAWPDQGFQARITRIAPAIDTSRGSVELTLAVQEPVPDFLRDDMTVSVSVLTASLPEALVIPRDAVAGAELGARRGEIKVLEDGRVVARSVELALLGDTQVAVRTGLQLGEQVLADPAYAVGARVRLQPQAGAGLSTASVSTPLLQP